MPVISSADKKESRIIERHCLELFPQQPTQYVHSLEVHLPGKNTTSVIGITNVFPSQRRLETIIMTIEGLVVFHARYDSDRKEVIKSVEPFTSEDFSTGLLKDIQLIFLHPDGNLFESGSMDDQSPVCRYHWPAGKTVDIVINPENKWEIRQYNPGHQLIKTITPEKETKSEGSVPGTYDKLSLKTTGIFGYQLTMTLIQSEPIEVSP